MSGSDDEDEAEVIIKHGDITETIPLSDANNGQKVKDRFGLDHEPAFVLTKKNKRVNFGSLKPGISYNLEDSDKIPGQKVHTQNAVVISNAVYKTDPTAYLTESSPNHTISTVCAVSKYSAQGVMLAVGKVRETNTLYVAFRGTATWKDAVTDADIHLKEKPSILGGKVHSGFDKRAATVPLDQILHCAREENCQTIITCGHSLGGAVSSITAIDLMIHLGRDPETTVFNITFGSPFFANDSVRQTCKRERYERNMLHYVGHQDVVPGILSMGHTIKEISRRIQSTMNSATGWKITNQKIQKYMKGAVKVTSFLLQNLPWDLEDDVKSDMQVLTELADSILSDVKGTELGQQFSPDHFVPIGNFYVLENDVMSLLATEKMTANIQEAILKEPLRRITGLGDVTKGHSLLDYYTASLALISKLPQTTPRTLEAGNMLQPVQTGKGWLHVQESEEGRYFFTLRVTGSFLMTVQLDAETNYFKGLPFGGSTALVEGDKETLIITDQSEQAHSSELYNLSQICLQIATVFGHTTVNVTVKKLNLPPSNDMMKEPVASILSKSILRCLTLSSLRIDPRDGQNNQDNTQDVLKSKVESFIELLGGDIKTEFEELWNQTEPLQHKQKIQEISRKIFRIVTKTNNFSPQAALMKLLGLMLNGPLFWSVTLMIESGVEEAYYKMISNVCDEIRKGPLLTIDDNFLELECQLQVEEFEERKELNDEAQLYGIFGFPLTINNKKLIRIIKRKRIGMKVLLKGNMLINLMSKREALSPDSSEKVLSHLSAASRASVEYKLKQLKIINDLRIIYSQQCFIGFVGPQNAGKSTLLNKLFNKSARTGMRDHTLEPTRYTVADNIMAIDFPGSDSLQDHKGRFAECGHMNNFFVYVMPYNGTPSESLVENVRMAYSMQKVAGKSAKTVFCINKAARETGTFDDVYKKEFVDKIRKDIKEKDFTDEEGIMKKWVKENAAKASGTSEMYQAIKAENKELKQYTLDAISDEDFIFTDWESDPDPVRGIKGPDEVKRRIQEYLAINIKIRTEDNLDI